MQNRSDFFENRDFGSLGFRASGLFLTLLNECQSVNAI